MEKCKHCGEEFENRGYLMAHWREGCPMKETSVPTETPKEIFPTANISGETFVLVEPDEYQRLIDSDQLAVKQANIISDLQRQLVESKQIDAITNATLYWPISRLPEEVSLLGEGQYLGLRCMGRIKGDKVEIDTVELTR